MKRYSKLGAITTYLVCIEHRGMFSKGINDSQKHSSESDDKDHKVFSILGIDLPRFESRLSDRNGPSSKVNVDLR